MKRLIQVIGTIALWGLFVPAFARQQSLLAPQTEAPQQQAPQTESVQTQSMSFQPAQVQPVHTLAPQDQAPQVESSQLEAPQLQSPTASGQQQKAQKGAPRFQMGIYNPQDGSDSEDSDRDPASE